MTVDPKQPNTIILAILEIDSKAICVGNLVTNWGIEQEAILATGNSALVVARIATSEAQTIRAKQIVIFTNHKPLVDLYTHPIRLPLRRPADLDKHYTEWEIMRNLCHFDRWQFKHLPAENMKRTMELWQQHYTNQ